MKKTFSGEKDFEAYYNAEKWLREHGFNFGSMERNSPIGISKDEWISECKWRYISQQGKNSLDGVICDGDHRGHFITVIIFDDNDHNCYFGELGDE